MLKVDELKIKIEIFRAEMEEKIIKSDTLTNQNIISISQELDKLLNQYNNLISK